MNGKWLAGGILAAAVASGWILASLATRDPASPAKPAPKMQLAPVKEPGADKAGPQRAGGEPPPIAAPARPKGPRGAAPKTGPDLLREDLGDPEKRERVLSEMRKAGVENPEAQLAQMERMLETQRGLDGSGGSPVLDARETGPLPMELGLSPVQRESVAKQGLWRDARRKEARQAHAADPASLARALEEIERGYRERIDEILTPEQRRQWRGER